MRRITACRHFTRDSEPVDKEEIMKNIIIRWIICVFFLGTFSCSTQQVQMSNHDGSNEEVAGKLKKDYRSSGSGGGKGISQLKQGKTAFRDSDYYEALDHYQQSLKRFQNSGNNKGMIDALNGMSSTYRDLGQMSKAQQSVEQALTLSRSAGYRNGEAEALCITGRIYMDRAQYEAALAYLKQALTIKIALHDANWKGIILSNIGFVNYQIGQPRKALRYLEKALAIHRNTANRRAEAFDLSQIGVVYRQLRQFEKAINFHEQALTIFREVNWRRQEASDLAYLGRDFEALGRNDEALTHYEQSYSISREIGYLRGQANALNNIGFVCLKLDRNPKAVEAFEESLKISEDLGTQESLQRTQWGLGKTMSRMNRPDEAIAHYEQALNAIESIRAGLSEGETRTHYMSGKLRIYDELIELLEKEHQKQPTAGYDRRSLEIFERKQGRRILEEVGNSGAKHFAGLPERITEKETELDENLDELQTSLSYERSLPPYPHKLDQVRSLEENIRQVKETQRALKEEIKTSFPDYYAIRYPQPATLAELQKNVLNPGELILVYGVMENFTCIWGIGKDSFEFYKIATGQVALDEKVKQFRAEMLEVLDAIQRKQPDYFITKVAHDSLGALRESGRELTETLLPRNVRNMMTKAKTLYIVPSGPLYFLPFEALVMASPSAQKGFSYLIEGSSVSYLSSASLLKSLREAMARRKDKAIYPLIAFANPVYSDMKETTPGTDSSQDVPGDIPPSGESPEEPSMRARAYLDFMGGHFAELPETENEARQVKAIMEAPDQSTPLQLKNDASRSNVLRLNNDNKLRTYRYLVFSCHGILPDEVDQIRQPALVLSNPDPETHQDGFLTMADVFQFSLNADLVTLSACNTGMGKVLRSEGIVGLTRAFMYAGASAAVVNLWSVESRSAIMVTTGFYRNLKNGESRSEALQSAKLRLIRGEEGGLYAHPFFWAPTIIFGEGS
jgi:CHAT domain-containing protein/Tfp pilus assembly protein PilF